jgi:phosphotransferase system enzyme I (PtsI)
MRHLLSGNAAARGSALGRARVRLPHALDVEETRITAADVDAELERIHEAVDIVRAEMHTLRQRLHGALAHEVGEFVDLHALLLDDPELLQGIDALIRTGLYSADYALRLQRDRIAAVFEGMDDAYLRSRIDDIDQVIGRLHAALHRREADLQGVAGEILVTDSIAPAELAQLQAQGVVGVVTAGGSPLSHSAILARSLHLPLVVGATQALLKVNDGDVLSSMAPADWWCSSRTPPTCARTTSAVIESQARAPRTQPPAPRSPAARWTASTSSCGRMPNRATTWPRPMRSAPPASACTAPNSCSWAAANCRTRRPSSVRIAMPCIGMTGRTVTIRTLDLGADKADKTGLALRDEPNPALGLRGVRLSLAREGCFARSCGRWRAPPATARCARWCRWSAGEEMRTVRRALDAVLLELRSEGFEVADHVPLGAMIEVPSAAISLPDFIGLCDFLSIGTNDLVQYLLAADRTNEALGELYSPLHPAVLRLLRDVIRIANRRGKPVAVCGEIAGDARCSPAAARARHRRTQPASGDLLEVRRAVRGCDLSACARPRQPCSAHATAPASRPG